MRSTFDIAARTAAAQHGRIAWWQLTEDGFLRLLRAHDLPLPRTNVDRGGDKVDCHRPHDGLTVELQSYRHHATRVGFETDLARRRRSNHRAFSYGDVFERGAATIAELTADLDAPARS